MLSKIAMLVTGIILLGATAALAEFPEADSGNVRIEMAVEYGMDAAATYLRTHAAPSAWADDSPALYVPTSAAPSLFTTDVDQQNDNPLHEW